MLEEIKNLETKNNAEYFDEEWDLLVWMENNFWTSEEELEERVELIEEKVKKIEIELDVIKTLK
jgi:hypothetical protein